MKRPIIILSLILWTGAIYSQAQLVQSSEQQTMISTATNDKSAVTPPQNAWWSDRTAGYVGGIAGSAIGLISGLIGALIGMGKARRLAFSLVYGIFIFGVISLVLGIAAVILSQPYAVYYPLLLLGLMSPIIAIIFGSLRNLIRKRYEEIELRKIDAMDIQPYKTIDSEKP